MHTVGANEARIKLPQLLRQAEEGEEVIITRRGKPVAVLAPYDRKTRAEKAIETFRQMRQKYSTRGLDIREMIEEGRM